MTRRPAARRLRRQRGLTILETAIASGILIAVLAIAAGGTMRAIDAQKGTMGKLDLERRAASGLERVTERLVDCGASAITEDLTTPGGSSVVTFRRPQGWDGTKVTLGPVMAISLAPDAFDPVNGTDDDKDGVVDQRVVQIRVGTAEPVVLVRNVLPLLDGETANGADENANGLVDETGFVASRAGENVTLRLSVRRKGPDGILRTATSTATVRVGK